MSRPITPKSANQSSVGRATSTLSVPVKSAVPTNANQKVQQRSPAPTKESSMVAAQNTEAPKYGGHNKGPPSKEQSPKANAGGVKPPKQVPGSKGATLTGTAAGRGRTKADEPKGRGNGQVSGGGAEVSNSFPTSGSKSGASEQPASEDDLHSESTEAMEQFEGPDSRDASLESSKSQEMSLEGLKTHEASLSMLGSNKTDLEGIRGQDLEGIRGQDLEGIRHQLKDTKLDSEGKETEGVKVTPDEEVHGGTSPHEVGMVECEKAVGSKDAPLTGVNIEVGGGATGLKDGPTELKDGSTGLKDGSTDLKDGSTDLKDGPTELKDGSTGLKDGPTELKDRPTDLKDGSTDLKDGPTDLLTDGPTDLLKDGPTDLKDGPTDLLKDGSADLKDGPTCTIYHDGAYTSLGDASNPDVIKVTHNSVSGSWDLSKLQSSVTTRTGEEAGDLDSKDELASRMIRTGEEALVNSSQKGHEMADAWKAELDKLKKELAEVRREMVSVVASKDEEIAQLQLQSKELVTHLEELRNTCEQTVEEKKVELASKEEEVARIRQQLEEELQTKNQQVKQYKKQVDSYKAELEKCQAALQQNKVLLEGCEKELEGCRGSQNEAQVELGKKITENEGLQQSLCEGQSRWRQSIDQVRGMLLDEGAVPPVRSGEEAALLEVIDEYRKRMEGKLCAMEEKYQSAIKAAEEGSKKKQEVEEQPHFGDERAHSGTNPTLHVQIDGCSAVFTEGANSINPTSHDGECDDCACTTPYIIEGGHLSSISSHQLSSINVIAQATPSLGGESAIAIAVGSHQSPKCPYVERLKSDPNTHLLLEEGCTIEHLRSRIRLMQEELAAMEALESRTSALSTSSQILVPECGPTTNKTESSEKVVTDTHSGPQSDENDADKRIHEVAATVGGADWIESEGDVPEVPVGVIAPKGVSHDASNDVSHDASHDVQHDVSHGGTLSDTCSLISEEAGTCGGGGDGLMSLLPGGGGSPAPAHSTSGPWEKESVLPPPGLLPKAADVCAVMEEAHSDHLSTLLQKLKEVEKERDGVMERCKQLEHQLQTLKTSHSSLEEGRRWQAEQFETLQHDLGKQEQKVIEAQSALLKCESEKKHLIAEIARISEENNVALLETAKKHAAEKETLQAEMELYQTQAVMYKEDFVQERKDRENMHGRVVKKDEELARIKQQLEEELLTKNQQVKQYKKQVDSYKAELEKCQAALQQNKVLLEGCEKELEVARRSQNDYKKQVDYHKAELQKCQEELRISKMDFKQLNEKWIREKLLETKVSENERMVQPQATVQSSSSRPKTEYAMAHNMASAAMSHDGRTQGYQALTHTAHRSPMPPDQSVPPPTPSNQLVSSRTIQGAQPPPQAQYSNADRMQYESRDYPHKPHGDTFNDYGYNQGPQSLPTHSSTLPQQYGGGYIYDDQSSRRPYQRLPPQQSPHVQQSDIEAGYDADGRDYALNQPSLQLRQERPVGPYPPNNYYSKSEWIHPQPRDEDIRSQQLKQQQLYQGARFPHLSHQYPEGPPQGMLGHPIAASESAGVRQPRPPQSYEAGESSVGMPYDPNLTCTYCGERFRVGEIQNFRRHVTAHGGGRGRNE